MVEKVCVPGSGAGKALVDLLTRTLGIPRNCRGFDVHFEVGEPVLVTVRTYGFDGDVEVADVDAIQSVQFKLVEVIDGDS